MAVPGFSINVRIGIWLDDLRLGIKQGVKTIAPLGVEVLGIDAFSADVSPKSLSPSGRRDLAHFLRSKGSSLAAVRADVGGRRLADPKELDVNLAKLKDAIQLAADLGVQQIVIPAGFIPAKTEKDNSSVRQCLSEGARALASFAATSSVRICWLGGSETPEVLQQFLDEIDSSGILEVDLNPGAFVMRGLDPLNALNAFSNRVSIARAVDHYRGGAEAPFGKGDVRWGEVLVGLSTLKRTQPIPVLAGCSLDVDRFQALSSAFRQLQALRQRPI